MEIKFGLYLQKAAIQIFTTDEHVPANSYSNNEHTKTENITENS